MTEFIVKCADVSWQRHSVSIYVGNFRTKRQLEDGIWPESLSLDVSGGDDNLEDQDGAGSDGLWITDDLLTDRFPIWRPPYTISIKRAALMVNCAIPLDASYYYKFRLYNSTGSVEMAYLYGSTTSLSALTPTEMTVIALDAILDRTESLLLDIEDNFSSVPIRGLSITVDYEPA